MSERIFEWLDNVRGMPQMFLNHSPEERDKQLLVLQMLVHGYSMALQTHAITSDVQNFELEFDQFLHAKYGWGTSCGFVDAIRQR
jgi:hypothetical protein